MRRVLGVSVSGHSRMALAPRKREEPGQPGASRRRPPGPRGERGQLRSAARPRRPAHPRPPRRAPPGGPPGSRRAGLRGLAALPRRVRTTEGRHGHPIAPNRIGRSFEAARPNQVRLGDLTPAFAGAGSACARARAGSRGLRGPTGATVPAHASPRSSRLAHPQDRRLGHARDGSHGPDRGGSPRDGRPEAAPSSRPDLSYGQGHPTCVRAVPGGARRRRDHAVDEPKRETAWTTRPWRASSPRSRACPREGRGRARPPPRPRHPRRGQARPARLDRAPVTTPTASTRRRDTGHRPTWSAWRPNHLHPSRAGSRCACIASVFAQDITKPAAFPLAGQMAPKSEPSSAIGPRTMASAHFVRWSCGARGLVARRARRRVMPLFWPTRASSCHQSSMAAPGGSVARIASRSAGRCF